MKKLLIALFSTLMLAGCANDPYKIDPVATANAPWEVGGIITNKYNCPQNGECYQIFLGMLTENKALVQIFYSSGNKFTDPFVVIVTNSNGLLADGPVISWHEGGQKMMSHIYQNGKTEGVFYFWDQNGVLRIEGSFQDDKEVGVWRKFDENGNLIDETDHGTP